MKFWFSPVIIFILVVVACNKNKITAAPQVTVKSISPGQVYQGNVIKLDTKFTDKEGDLDSVLIVYKWYANTTVTFNDTLRYSIGGLNIPPDTRQADIIVQFAYGRFVSDYALLPGSPVAKDTTASLGLVLVDKAGLRSGYSESGKIRLLNQ